MTPAAANSARRSGAGVGTSISPAMNVPSVTGSAGATATTPSTGVPSPSSALVSALSGSLVSPSMLRAAETMFVTTQSSVAVRGGGGGSAAVHGPVSIASRAGLTG